ncbi:hypothetical protein [Brevibacterium sp.]|uniref:hypothetical protein n=1 Tax=Brevibacterium sp. TaxID=1701 RepID=UPI0025C17F6B|nr:hypothetical protein [Brevibacterium sp.]
MSVPPPPQHPPPRRAPQPPVGEEGESLTTQLYVGGASGAETASGAAAEGESTQMLSMEELRQLAAESHVDEIDGPREAGGRGTARKAGAEDEARAQAQAPPSVFSAQPGASAPLHAPQHGSSSLQGVFPTAAAPVAPAPQGSFPQSHSTFPQGASGSQGVPGAADPYGSSGRQAGVAPHLAAAGGAGHGGVGQGGAQPNGAPQGDGRQKRRGGLPPVAVVFVIIAALVVFGVGGWITYDVLTRGGDSSQDVAPPPATEAAEGQDDESADEDAQGGDDLVTGEDEEPAESFVVPSGNIGCTIDSERARCIIKSWDFTPPEAPDSCDMDKWGSVVVANRDGAGFSCTEANFPVGAETLEYGQSVSAHGMSCHSSEQGVRCEADETEAGFQIARAGASFDQP